MQNKFEAYFAITSDLWSFIRKGAGKRIGEVLIFSHSWEEWVVVGISSLNKQWFNLQSCQLAETAEPPQCWFESQWGEAISILVNSTVHYSQESRFAPFMDVQTVKTEGTLLFWSGHLSTNCCSHCNKVLESGRIVVGQCIMWPPDTRASMWATNDQPCSALVSRCQTFAGAHFFRLGYAPNYSSTTAAQIDRIFCFILMVTVQRLIACLNICQVEMKSGPSLFATISTEGWFNYTSEKICRENFAADNACLLRKEHVKLNISKIFWATLTVSRPDGIHHSSMLWSFLLIKKTRHPSLVEANGSVLAKHACFPQVHTTTLLQHEVVLECIKAGSPSDTVIV